MVINWILTLYKPGPWLQNAVNSVVYQCIYLYATLLFIPMCLFLDFWLVPDTKNTHLYFFIANITEGRLGLSISLSWWGEFNRKGKRKLPLINFKAKNTFLCYFPCFLTVENYNHQGLTVKSTDISGQIVKGSVSFGELLPHCCCCVGGTVLLHLAA